MDMASIFEQFVLGNANKLGHKTLEQMHVVFDRYLIESIKAQTRQHHGNISYQEGDSGGDYRIVLDSQVSIARDTSMNRGKSL